MCSEVGRRPRTGVRIDAEQLEEVAEYMYVGRLITSGTEANKETDQRITSGWISFGEYSHFFKDSKIPLCLKRKIGDTVKLPVMKYGAETWTLTKLQERKMADGGGPTKHGKIIAELNEKRQDPKWGDKIEDESGRYNRQSAVHETTVGRTYRQNERHPVGQDNIRVDTQRRKTNKRKT